MDHAAFHTTTAKSVQGSQQNSLAINGKGALAKAGPANLFELMFARLSNAQKASGTGDQDAQTALQGKNPALGSLKNIRVTETPDEKIGVMVDGKPMDPSTLQLDLLKDDTNTDLLKNLKSKKGFMDFLNSLLAGLPDGEKPVIGLSGDITKKDLANALSGSNYSGLVAAGLSPDQLTEAMAKFGQDVLKEHEGNESVAGVIVGLVKIMPPTSSSPFEAVIMPSAMFVGKSGSADAGELLFGSPADKFAARLNSLLGGLPAGAGTGSATPTFNPMAFTGKSSGEALTGQGNITGKTSLSGSGESALLSGGAATGKGENIAHMLNGNLLGGFEFPFAGELWAQRGWSDPVTERMGLHPLGHNINNPAQLTQIITQAQHASAPHPATQVVAAHLQKAAGNGDSRNLTLRLDPPDLGRVVIRMQFNAKDKSVKAHMLIEKPETFLMLQRDSQALERALQNAGLEVDGESLNFELAQDGQEFSHDGGHDGQGQMGRGRDKDGDETMLIEATMTWFVDPETGMQRYDILA